MQRYRPQPWARANAVKARAALYLLHIQLKLGTREPWQQYPVPTKHRCKAKSKRSGVRCRKWALKKPDGGYFRTCQFHGAPGALVSFYGKERPKKVINERRKSMNQWRRYERKWAQRAAEYDASASRVAGAATPLESEFRPQPRPKKPPPLS